MARITVEDCIDKVDSPYDLVLIAKERVVQLNSGEQPTVDTKNDKNTVIALKEIAEKKVSVKDLQTSAINKLRKHTEEEIGFSSQDESEGDDFENIYKGEVSKSGAPILPSKRARKIPEKIEASKKEKEKVQVEMPQVENLPKNNESSLQELEDKAKQEEGLNNMDNPKTSDSA